MDKEALIKKLNGLRKEREQAIATVNMIGGAIRFCEELLIDLDKPADPKSVEK